jgi:cell division protein FtsQ
MGGWVASGRLLSLPLLIISLGALIYITTNQRFSVRTIHVEGANLLRSDDAISMSGALGHSIWLIDTGQIAANIRSSAYVEQASAALTLPDQLTISIRERQPEIRWKSGGQLLLVDADGRVLGPDTTAPVSNTLVIDDQSGKALQPNDQVDPAAIDLGRKIALRLPTELRLTPSRIGWGSDTGITVDLSGGRVVIFGQSDHLDRKLAVLANILNEGQAFTYLDLRPETPYYRNQLAITPTPPAETP